MPNVAKLTKLANEITEADLDKFIELNQDFLTESAIRDYTIPNNTKFLIPTKNGESKRKSFRTIDAGAYLTKLYERNNDDRLGRTLLSKLYKPNETNEKDKYIRNFSSLNLLNEKIKESQGKVTTPFENLDTEFNENLNEIDILLSSGDLTIDELNEIEDLIKLSPPSNRVNELLNKIEREKRVAASRERQREREQEEIRRTEMEAEDEPAPPGLIETRPFPTLIQILNEIKAKSNKRRDERRQMEQRLSDVRRQREQAALNRRQQRQEELIRNQEMAMEDVNVSSDVNIEERQRRRQQLGDAAEIRMIDTEIEGLEREMMQQEDRDVLSFRDSSQINELIKKQVQDLENQAMERKQMSGEDRDVLSFLDDNEVNRAINRIMDEMMRNANRREQERIQNRDDTIRMRIRELIREGFRQEEQPQVVSDNILDEVANEMQAEDARLEAMLDEAADEMILEEAADEMQAEDARLEAMLDEAADEISNERPMPLPSAPDIPVGETIPTARVIPEPVIPEDNRRFFMRDGRQVDFSDESIEGRLRQIEFISSFVEELTDIPADVRETARITIDTIREANANDEPSESIFSRVYRFGKGLLGAVASIPIIPPQIRAGAAGTLIGVEAIEQTVNLIRGEADSTEAIRAGANLLGEVVPGASELADGINAGLDVVDAGLEIRDVVRTAIGSDEGAEAVTEVVEQPDEPEEGPEVREISFEDKTQSEQLAVLSGVSGPNVYYEPIHPDALGIYFKDSNFPEWDNSLFNDRKKRFGTVSYEVYVPYLQQQTRFIWEKHSVDLLIPILKYTKPNDPPEMIIKENNEVVQIWNVIMRARVTLDFKKLLESMDAKLNNLATDDSEAEAQNGKETTGTNNEKKQGWKHYNNDVSISLNTSKQNELGQKYFGEKETKAEMVTREGKIPLEDRKILSLGWSGAGRKFPYGGQTGVKVGSSKIRVKALPDFEDDTRNIRDIKSIRIM